MPARKQSEFRTIEKCDEIHAAKKKEMDEKMKENKAWAKIKLTVSVTIMIAIATLGIRMLMGHVTNETAQNVSIGKTEVEVNNIKEDVTETKEEVKEIKKEVQQLEGMDKKLDMILFYQEFGQ